jgi:ABC-2 type transport system ATP-binding protein
LRIEEVAEARGLVDLLDAGVGTLSGGQQRRLRTAMALLHRPRLLFLDKPTVGADVQSRRQILQVVRRLAEDGCAVCYATHYLPEVERLDARVAVLHQGRIVADASVQELIRHRGRGTLRLTFRGDPPALPGMHRDGQDLIAITDDPARALPEALGGLGQALGDLDAVSVSQPSLESAYLDITGEAAVSADQAPERLSTREEPARAS